MKVDLDLYRVNCKTVIATYNRLKDEYDFEEIINRIAIGNSLPLIAVIYYLAEEFGMDEQKQTKIDSLNKFYNCDGILNYKEKL